jgi:hypothetical protein
MFANEISFFTVTISTISTIITISTFTFIKKYIQIFDKVKSCDKIIQTDIKVMVDSETQTDGMNCSSFIEIEYIPSPVVEDTLENLILLAKDQLNIQKNPSNYKWFF